MEHSTIEEHQVVDRYLMGQLPAEEAERFEEHYLHCQQCLDQLKVAEKLQQGFKQAAAADVAQAVVTQRLGVLAWLARSPRAVMAAALLAVALVPAGLLLRPSSDHFQPQINTLVLTMSPERSAPSPDQEPSHVIRLSGTPEWLVLSLELDRPEHTQYRVTLLRGGKALRGGRALRDGEDKVWQQDGFAPNHLDAVSLSLHSSWLQTGDYVAKIEGLTGSGPVGVAHFSFRVLADN